MSKLSGLRFVIFSFGYKYGQPLDVNLLLDVRCLPNPYWEKSLRPRTGQDGDVADYVLESDEGRKMRQRSEEFLRFWLQQQVDAGKNILRIAIGCTGGRHRSVALAEALAAVFRGDGLQVECFHRDIEKDEA